MPPDRGTSPMHASELRQDRTSGRWVIVAPERQTRPRADAARTATTPARARPRFDATCPFCPGNEAQLLGIVAETRLQAARDWTVRVVPNKYPALQPSAGPRDDQNKLRLRAGYGFHEVMIESPRHDADLTTLGDAELDAVIAAYRDRSSDLIARPGIEAAILFRNYGTAGGASLVHPHAQIIALGLVPANVAMLADWGMRYHAEHASCPTCDEIAAERDCGFRIIQESPSYVAIVPFAAEHPFETWIAPKQHQSSFTELASAHCAELGALLRRTLRRLQSALDDPAYNLVIDSADRQRLGAPYMHWRIRIVPEVARSGGFELATGMAINPSSPELDAAILRTALSADEPSPVR